MSLPISSGAAITAQRLKWVRYSVAVMPPLPTSSMSGSFQWPGPGERGEVVVAVHPGDNAGPVVADVTRGAPQVADVRAPLPHLRRAGAAPLADAVGDGPAGVGQRVAHRLVPGLRVDVLVVA